MHVISRVASPKRTNILAAPCALFGHAPRVMPDPNRGWTQMCGEDDADHLLCLCLWAETRNCMDIVFFEENKTMTVVAEILKSKADPTVHAVRPDDSVFEALQRMADKSIGALLVVDGEAIVGIVTERDYARKIALMGRTSALTRVRDVMTAPVLFVKPTQTSEECMALMTNNRVRHLPVVADDKLVGLISIGDLVKEIISEQKFTIEQLEHYITGERG